MDLGLSGKVAMVAGASRGLGFAVADALADGGADLSILSRDEAAIEAAAERLAAERGAAALASAGDTRSADDVARWFAATEERFGAVDLLFANTGGPPAGEFADFDDDAWREAFELVVVSVIRMVRLAVPRMRARGGSVLVGTSSSVKEPIPNLTLSNVLRPAVGALAKTLALELAADGIRVNQLVPGRIDTERVRRLDRLNAERTGVSVAAQRERASAGIPLGRYGEPEEFGRAAAFLLSDAASYITGATLQVDGGKIRSVF